MDNKARVKQFFTFIERGNIDALADAYADDGYLWTMGNTLISGKFGKEQIRMAANGVLQTFPEGLKFTLTGITAEGDRVAVEAESMGKHVSGRLYHNRYHFLFVFRDGKVVELKEYLDTEHVTDVICGGQRPAAAA